VWIGHGAMILSGVTIGDGACIGAGSVVAKTVPPYAVVSGNPAQVRRMRFSPVQVEQLLRIRWWEWPIERIRAFAGQLCSPDIDAFIAAAADVPSVAPSAGV
jgi:acyl-[acyl carrier protein]--UDP-N-acetylglucosamine O-acyltransferase